MKHLATFCGDEDCKWCPEVFLSDEHPDAPEVQVRDDFGASITLSLDQFRALVESAKRGLVAQA